MFSAISHPTMALCKQNDLTFFPVKRIIKSIIYEFFSFVNDFFGFFDDSFFFMDISKKNPERILSVQGSKNITSSCLRSSKRAQVHA